MKTLLLNLTLATAASLGAVSAAHAATDFLLELDGVKGESSLNASTVEFRWTQAFAGPTFDPFDTAFAGGVSVATGDLGGPGTWDRFALRVYEPGSPTIVLEYLLLGAAVGRTPAPGGSSGQWLSIDPASAPILSYRPPLPGGGRGDLITGSWTTNGAFVGDPGVFRAFDELGAVRWADGTLVITSAVPEPAAWLLMLGGVGSLALRRQARAGQP